MKKKNIKQRFELFILYFFLISVLAVGAFAFIQCIPEPVEEETYEYESLQAFIPTPEPAASSPEEEVAPEPQYDFEGLAAQNNDFVGWLSIPDTDINFPVVQGSNNQYYLRRSFSKTYSIYGCPFLDTRTTLTGDNLVIHGHNMGNNRTEMFSMLTYFQDPEYAKEHSTIYFASPDQAEGEYELFAVLNVDVNDPSMDYIISEFETDVQRQEFLENFQTHSLYPTKTIPSGEILILSTCNRVYGADNRLLIVAVKSE